VDASWELRALESNFYAIDDAQGAAVGFFAIHEGRTLLMFHLSAACGQAPQDVFAEARRREFVMGALVPTGDEFFLSHALDASAGIEKESYIAIYADGAGGTGSYRNAGSVWSRPPNSGNLPAVWLEQADPVRDRDVLGICYDFLKYELEHPDVARACEELYIVRAGVPAANDPAGTPSSRNIPSGSASAGGKARIVGFGIIDYQRIVDTYASLGLIILEEHRQKRYGASALLKLRDIAAGKGRIPVSECQYCNHSSKKLMESVGGYVKSRLLRIRF
jgi:hypothetical protein